jgi:hypothetical protein
VSRLLQNVVGIHTLDARLNPSRRVSDYNCTPTITSSFQVIREGLLTVPNAWLLQYFPLEDSMVLAVELILSLDPLEDFV